MQITTTQSSLIPLYRQLMISTLIALLAVVAYFILPERATQVLPDPHTETHLFFDNQNGGSTRAEWVDKDSYSFKCIAANGGIAAPYCGMNIHFGQASASENYLHYQRMELKINYRGDNQRLRLKMYSFRPAQMNEKFRETMTGQEISILASETSQLIVMENYGLGRNEGVTATPLSPLENTTNNAPNTLDISIDLVPPITPGEQLIQLESIVIYNALLPADTWYLAVAVLWLVSNLLFIARHLILQERRIRNDSQRLSSLAHYSEDLIQESQHYKLLSSTDALTGALNRNGFAAEMSQFAPDGRLSANTSLMIIDLDNFKRINDSRGHDAGDVVLRETAQIIHKNTRATDRFIRWGGEEFVLLSDNTNTQPALLLAEKIRAAVELNCIKFHDEEITVTISIGLGVARAQENFDALFNRTDQALYKAKHMGRNCIVLSENHTQEKSQTD